MTTTPAKLAAPPQTAQVAWINRQWAEHPVNGLTPARLAGLLRQAEQGDITAQADLFSDIEERDAHIFAELSKRRRAVTKLDWSLVPPQDATPAEKQSSEKLEALIRSMEELPQLLFALTDAIGHGFSAVEIEWTRRRDGIWIPKRFHPRGQRMFQLVRTDLCEELRLCDMTATGQELRPLSWLLHTSAARNGSMARTPLCRTLSWLFLYKAFALGDWAEFLEVYGYPIRIGKYGPNASKDERETLLTAVIDIGRRAGGIIPESMNITLLDAVDGDPKAFSELIAWAEKSASKAILGGTLSSQADGATSTNALGTVHDDARLDIRDDDAISLAGTLTRDLVLAIGQVNGLVLDPLRCARWVFDTQQPEDLSLYAEALPKLVSIGMLIDRDWAHERLRIPKASSPESALKADSGAVSPNPSIAALTQEKASRNFAGAIAASFAPVEREAQHQTMVDALETETSGALGDWIASIKAMVERAESMEQLRNNLLGAYGHLPVERMAAVMETGFALRALQGLSDVQDESNVKRPAGGGAENTSNTSNARG